jgi:hypothetical protein
MMPQLPPIQRNNAPKPCNEGLQKTAAHYQKVSLSPLSELAFHEKSLPMAGWIRA